jgi:hypothetical protein
MPKFNGETRLAEEQNINIRFRKLAGDSLGIGNDSHANRFAFYGDYSLRAL